MLAVQPDAHVGAAQPAAKPAGRLGTVHNAVVLFHEMESKFGVPFRAITPSRKGFVMSAPLALADRISFLPAKGFQMFDKYVLGYGPKECVTHDGPLTAGVTGTLAATNALVRITLLIVSAIVSRAIFVTVAIAGYALEAILAAAALVIALALAATVLGLAVGLAGVALGLFLVVNATGIPTAYLLYRDYQRTRAGEGVHFIDIDDGAGPIPESLDGSDTGGEHLDINLRTDPSAGESKRSAPSGAARMGLQPVAGNDTDDELD